MFSLQQRSTVRRWGGAALVVIGLVVGFITRNEWLPSAHGWWRSVVHRQQDARDKIASQATGGRQEPDEYVHAQSEVASLELSAQAQGNLGLTSESLQPVQLETFRRTISIPGIVVERPGQTRIEVSTPMAGVITAVHAVTGESVQPGVLLFELRITAEELVESQTDLLKTVGDLEVENREIARLTKITESGAVAQKTLLERQYAKDKLENLLLAQREALRLHGLSEHQIDEIVIRRRLFRDLRIVAPFPGASSKEIELSRTGLMPVSYVDLSPSVIPPSDMPLIITQMPVQVGQTVAEGTTLAVLADYSELYIEGRTFESDVESLTSVAKNNWKITAEFDAGRTDREVVHDLDFVYSSNEIQAESRTLPFYVRLRNEVLRTSPSPNNHQFVEWKHRPGRRVQLYVPVEEWTNQIVLPIDAVAQEGAESYVFQQNGKQFTRIPVRIQYRDSRFVVIANDGSVFPGDVVARRGAHQMQMALKSQSGGGVDPHAGHNH